MVDNSKLNQVKIIAIAVVIVCIIGFIFLILNQYQSSRSAGENLFSLKTHLSNIQAEMEEASKSIEQLKQEQEEFKKTLFDEQDVPAFLDSISNSATKCLVHVVEMKTQQFSEVRVPKEMLGVGQLAKVKVEDNQQGSNANQPSLSEMLTLASMPIHIKISGTFEAIVRFLNSMENYHQLLTVSNVEIVSNQDYPQLTCDFNLRIYSLKKLKDIKL